MKKQPKFAGKIVVLDSNDPIQHETEEIQARIRERAYELSQIRSHSGREVDDWLSAESEIISVPPAELIEKEDAFEVRLAVAGINPDDVTVMTTVNQLLIKCEFHHKHGTDNGIVHLCDFKSATVFRPIHFPTPVNLKTLKIEFDDGILRITARKEIPEPQTPPRRAPARKASGKRTRGAA